MEPSADSLKGRDHALVAGVRAGEVTAARSLIDRYGAAAYAYVEVMLGTPASATAAVARGFRLSLEAIERLPLDGHYLPFLLRAIRRDLRASVPGPVAAALTPAEQESLQRLLTVPVDAVGAGDRIKGALAAVSAAQRLGADLREVWVLMEVLRLDGADVAFVTNASESIVTARAEMAKYQMEQLLAASASPTAAPAPLEDDASEWEDA